MASERLGRASTDTTSKYRRSNVTKLIPALLFKIGVPVNSGQFKQVLCNSIGQLNYDYAVIAV